MKMVAANEFLEFAAGILDLPASDLSLDTAYGSVPAWDSVMHLRLTLEIESKYGVEIPVDEIADIRTLREFHRYL